MKILRVMMLDHSDASDKAFVSSIAKVVASSECSPLVVRSDFYRVYDKRQMFTFAEIEDLSKLAQACRREIAQRIDAPTAISDTRLALLKSLKIEWAFIVSYLESLIEEFEPKEKQNADSTGK